VNQAVCWCGRGVMPPPFQHTHNGTHDTLLTPTLGGLLLFYEWVYACHSPTGNSRGAALLRACMRTFLLGVTTAAGATADVARRQLLLLLLLRCIAMPRGGFDTNWCITRPVTLHCMHLSLPRA
jgi:hypothetical protein